MNDISDTLKADSTQLNAIDFGETSRTYTVASVRVVSGDQPVNIKLVEDDREYRPSKSMRRVLAAIWTPDSDTWVGKGFTLYCDPAVTWGGKPVGGIKVSHASGITGPKKVMLQESSSVRKPHVVQPLADAPTPPTAPTVTAEDIANSTDPDDLRKMWGAADEEMRALIQARVAELNGGAA